MPLALLIDDDRLSLDVLAEFVTSEGFSVRSAENLEKARSELASERFDLVVTDLQLPDGSALELLPDLEKCAATDVVFITGHASLDSALEAFRGGAVDYLTKPVEARRLRLILRKVFQTTELRAEVDSLRDELRRVGRFGSMIGASAPMQRLYDEILRVAPTDATVLISGETGTGKELVAETIHGLSPRARHPFVPVNCGAIPPQLIESELFGHERGSFTGATQRHRGLFERANGGTLFLDEITEMPPDLQVKLLRALETRSVHRVGGDRPIEIDVRIISATNRDAEEAVRAGKLREDLLYRLLVFPIHVAPLRERGGDLELLANHFLAALNRKGETSKRLSDEALARMSTYRFPGNVRELRNVVERAFILAPERIGVECLPFSPPPAAAPDTRLPIRVGMTTEEAERLLVLATLEHCDQDKKRAADLLGISLKTIYNRLNSYGAA